MEQITQFNIVKQTMLDTGYVSRNDMMSKYGISRLSGLIYTLREKYYIDTIQHKTKENIYEDCIYILKRHKMKKTDDRYDKLVKHFSSTNTQFNRHFTNDTRNG